MSQPLILLPQQQIPTTSLFYQALLKTMVSFVVRDPRQHPGGAGDAFRVSRVAPGIALDHFQTMQEAVESNTFSQSLGLYLVGSFAGLAIAMVIAGLYGVLVATGELSTPRNRSAHGARSDAGQRRRLDSSPGDHSDRNGSRRRPCPWPIAAGRLISGFLYQVKPLDPWTYVAVALAATRPSD